jgi:hypothetical protein
MAEITRTTKRCGIEDIQPALELLRLSKAELSRKLGYSSGAVDNWLKRDGSMPETARLALTALLGEAGAPAQPQTTFCILEITPGITPRVVASTTQLEEVILLRKSYFLVPKV